MADLNRYIDRPYARFELHSGDFLEIRYQPEIYVDVIIAQELLQTCVEIAGELAPLPVLVSLGNMRGITNDARMYLAQSDIQRQLCARVALVYESRIGRMLVNLFIHLQRPNVPTRAFSDRQRAIDWLLQPGQRARASRHFRVQVEPFEDSR
ncbi:MAG: hypothetical protein Tsb0020_19870 [Haliangiales bacterium]